jgi:hypothetical protein
MKPPIGGAGHGQDNVRQAGGPVDSFEGHSSEVRLIRKVNRTRRKHERYVPISQRHDRIRERWPRFQDAPLKSMHG